MILFCSAQSQRKAPLRFLYILPVCSLLATSAALANVVTFDDLPSVGCGGAFIPAGYRGVNWNNFGYANATVSDCAHDGYATALTSSPNVGFNLGGNLASITSTTPFTVTSGEFAAAWSDGLMISMTAKLGATTVGTYNFAANTTTKVLETFNFGPVTELDFFASGGTPNPNLIQYGKGTQFGVDDLNLTMAPEPAGVYLFGAILLALLFRVRQPAR